MAHWPLWRAPRPGVPLGLGGRRRQRRRRRADRFASLSSRVVFLSCFGRSDRPDRFLRTEPPWEVTVGVNRDRLRDRTVALMSYHPWCPVCRSVLSTAPTAPALVRRHRSEVRRLERLIAEQRAGHVVYAAGDSNFGGLRLAGLTSAWEGRE